MIGAWQPESSGREEVRGTLETPGEPGRLLERDTYGVALTCRANIRAIGLPRFATGLRRAWEPVLLFVGMLRLALLARA